MTDINLDVFVGHFALSLLPMVVWGGLSSLIYIYFAVGEFCKTFCRNEMKEEEQVADD